MRTEHGFARLVNFSDAVVAIAITLLILPLVDAAGDAHDGVWAFLVANAFQLFVFVLSFAVIGRFWLVHHRMYESAVAYNTPLLWANLFWLLTIVFLPFATELLASADRGERLAFGLYVGTMVLTCVAALLQQLVILRSPDLQAADARGTLQLRPAVTAVVIMLLALVAVLLFAQAGLFALLLFSLQRPLERLFDRNDRKRP